MSLKTKRLRAEVFVRAKWACECGCGYPFTPETGRLDHFFGRSKVPESVSNCWALCIRHDEAKTASKPSAAWWLRRFISHARRHGYAAELERAEARLGMLVAKGMAKDESREFLRR